MRKRLTVPPPPPHRFQKGVSGNPKGKAPGSRHKVLVAMDAVGQGAAMNVLQAAIHEALFHRDVRAMEIILKRVWPEVKGRTVAFRAPRIETEEDLFRAQAALIEAAARGEVTTDDAASLSTLFENLRRAVETTAHAAAIDNMRKEVDKLMQLKGPTHDIDADAEPDEATDD